MIKFKVIRLQDFRGLEDVLNDFKLGEIIDYQLTMPDYRVVICVLRYHDESKKSEKAKDDKATE